MTSTTQALRAAVLPRQRRDLSGFDFVALDVETWNGRTGSVCAVGLAVVRGGAVVDEYEALCHPAPELGEADYRHMVVNRLQLGDLYHAQSFGELFETVSAFVGDLPVVAHGAAADAAHLARACEVGGLAAPAWEWHCTEAVARRALDLTSWALPDVAAALALPRFSLHQAGAEARATAAVLLGLAERTGAVRLAHLPR
ncbi:3'-5' exonuclease [Quadrisphaera sp. KR29]|uniref:3'-5' exonuclease n=1 Tax=Quadrisphaera sp. KR29 TaxID=3461391 RepID=UPI004044800B